MTLINKFGKEAELMYKNVICQTKTLMNIIPAKYIEKLDTQSIYYKSYSQKN